MELHSLVLLESRTSKKLSHRIWKLFSSNVNLAIYVTIAVVIVCALIIPIFTELSRVRDIANRGSLGAVLRTSTRLMIFESLSIGCTLPMLSDNFLDRCIEKKAKISLSMWHRILFLSVFSTTGIFYLLLSDYTFIAYLYIVFNRSKIILVGVVTSYAVSMGVVMQSWRSKALLIIALLILSLRYIFEAYGLVYPEIPVLENIAVICYYLSSIMFFVAQSTFYYLLWCRYRVNLALNSEEKKESVYMLTCLFYVIACTLTKVIFDKRVLWPNISETVLVGYIIVQIVCILLATVLPARFMRKVVQVNNELARSNQFK
jgi:hypothetical protein